MKRNRMDQYPDQEKDSNPLSFVIQESLVIQEKIARTNLKILCESYDGMTDLNDHISCF